MAAAAKTETAEMPKHSLIRVMAGKYGLEANTFKTTIIKTIFPSDKQNPSNEQVAAFLVVANQYNLNPFIKEIYAFPGKGGGIIPIVSIDGWNTLLNREAQYDGIEFVDDRNGEGKLVSVTAKIFRKDRTHPTIVTEYMAECVRNTEPWKSHPTRMLRHKALIQCARYAFGFSGIYDQDEAERIAAAGDGVPPPVQIAVITEEQRESLVKLAQEVGVVEKLGAIVNEAGFEMLADITVDKFLDVSNAIRAAATPDVQHADAEIVESDEDEDADAIEGELIEDDSEEKEKSRLADLRIGAMEKFRELEKDDKKAFEKANKFLGTKSINDLGPDKLTDFINMDFSK